MITPLPASSGLCNRVSVTPPRFGGDYFRSPDFDTRFDLPGAAKLMYHTTGFFRDPDCYGFLAKDYIPKRFPQGAVIDSYGCSAGQEPYGLAMLLLKHTGLTPKVLKQKYPLHASDVEPGVVAMAQQGLYAFSRQDEDLDRFRELGLSPSDYLDPQPLSANKQREELLAQGGYTGVKAGHDCPEKNVHSVWRVNRRIKSLVSFAPNDFTKNLPPAQPGDKPRLVLLRNVLGHYGVYERRDLAQELFAALPSGSALVIGNFDLQRGVNAALRYAGFQQLPDTTPGAKFVFERP